MGCNGFFQHRGSEFVGEGLLTEATEAAVGGAASSLGRVFPGFSYVLAANDVTVVLNALADDSKLNVFDHTGGNQNH